MIGCMGDDMALPRLATADQVRLWVGLVAEQVEAGTLGAADLVEMLAGVRATAVVYNHAIDYLVWSAKESGATYSRIASVIGKGYVRAPAQRVERLRRSWTRSSQLADAMTDRITDPALVKRVERVRLTRARRGRRPQCLAGRPKVSPKAEPVTTGPPVYPSQPWDG